MAIMCKHSVCRLIFIYVDYEGEANRKEGNQSEDDHRSRVYTCIRNLNVNKHSHGQQLDMRKATSLSRRVKINALV